MQHTLFYRITIGKSFLLLVRYDHSKIDQYQCLIGRHKKLKRPKPWKNLEPITRAQVKRMRDEFWDTAPHYGGQKEIWDALRAASEADIGLARAIVDSAGVIVTSEDLSTCYDERGAKYELPKIMHFGHWQSSEQS
ncbi:hypothetical protein O6H91_02G048900 [Diphasiastrum complanatum]|uniref:Uncharacterized protein n=4 Tax=Diphasiastrum complanatum TaxID=34168 RepID=A0ACC2EF55_DIPCM|nr:hypothetical protein O6H91_02G048900 [Diphasiastrum complanatum]KAJ7565125.1 hypothetical protein O6H91_02G048900 [Diphasiastrum complanatum]